MAKQNVVEVLEKKLGSIIKLIDKWFNQWEIPIGKILHVLHHMKKSDLQGLINGTHKIVEQSEGRMVKTNEVFNIKNDQFHTDDFKEVVAKANPELRGATIKMITTNGNQNCHDLRKKIGEKNIATSETEALEILAATMTDKYKDGNLNIVYYLDAAGELCYVNCRWIDSEWYCNADADADVWSAGRRVFYYVA